MQRVNLEDVCQRASSNLRQKDIVGRSGRYPIYGAAGYLGMVDFYHQNKEYVAVVKDGAGIGRTMFLPANSSVLGTLQYLLPKDNIAPKYLYFAVKSMDLGRYYTGATIPHIYFKDYKLEKVPLPEKTEQERIVGILEKAEKIFLKRKAQLAELDELAKSRFVEMFGYDIKDCDQSEQVKEIANVRVGIVIQPTQYYTSNKEVGIKAFRSVNVRPFMVNDSDWVYFDPESHSRMSKTHIHSNEVLIVRSGANLGQSCVVPEEYEGSNAIDILIVKVDEEKILPGFFCAFVNFPMGRMQILDGQRGGAQKHLNVGVFEKARIPIPSIEKQREFVSFVEATDKSKLQAAA